MAWLLIVVTISGEKLPRTGLGRCAMVHSSDIAECFSGDYAEARRRFLSACKTAGAKLRAYANPARGPRAEELATDTAWIGPDDARTVLATISATHGVEGFCGSAAQIDWLTLGRAGRLPDGMAALHIHAINPHGFAWLRRVNEDGVDLNRNHIDFSRPLPANPDYEELADAIVPREISGPVLEAADAKLAAWRAKHGERAYRLARSGGQYTHPEGHCYGGTKPTWSRLITERIITDYALADRDAVAVIDFHTGLGPFGYGEPICDHAPDTLASRRARAWYGDSVTIPTLGTSSSPPLTGHARETWVRLLGNRVIFVALEFGTYSFERGLKAQRGDYWLHGRGTADWNATETRRIKADIRKHFFPDTEDWKEMVLFRSRQILRQAQAGLAQIKDS